MILDAASHAAAGGAGTGHQDGGEGGLFRWLVWEEEVDKYSN
jgi:hypothetical protein